jgi:glutamyl-Q tRNA(Asp) synthetase
MTRLSHAWRLDVSTADALAGPLTWREGDQLEAANPLVFGDVVLARKDAPASYHLAVTIDDAAQQITDVVRGRDLKPSTHIHRLLQALLDLPTPSYHHHPLLVDQNGRRFAKRDGAPSLAGLRAAGVDPALLVQGIRTGQMPGGYSLEEA